MILSLNGKSGSENIEESSGMPVVEQNILAPDVILKGSIEFSGELIVEGTVDGKIFSKSGDLVIGTSSNVTADIESANVSIEGEVKGNLVVKNRCILSQGSVLIGDIISSSVELESGAVFWGKSQIGKIPQKTGSGSK